MNSPARYWHPDENAPVSPDLSHDEKLWCCRQLNGDWALYWTTVDEAFQALERLNPDKMEALIAEVDDDNAASEWLDCRPETLADVIAGIGLLPALARKQIG